MKRWPVAGTAAAAAVVVLLLTLGADNDTVTKAAARAERSPVRVTISLAARGPDRRIPPAFLGLSAEYSTMPVYELQPQLFARVLALIRVPGAGPVTLRIGGNSADHSFYDPAFGTRPHWMFALTSLWLRRTAALLRRAGARATLDLNLVTGSPLLAARWAAVADRALPPPVLAGFEIGNEPDIYSRRFWRAVTRGSRWSLPSAISSRDYDRAFADYARALRALAPGVPLSGPALANPVRDRAWIRALLVSDRALLGAVTAHRYPLTVCVGPRSASYPTIGRLLSDSTTATVAHRLRHLVALVHSAGLPFRLSEFNSVTCGGRPGVSDSFATALWAPDALFELVRAGVDAVDIHVRTDSSNAAFMFGPAGLDARPLLYGMALFTRTLGDGAKLVPLHLGPRAPRRFKAWAVSSAGALRLLLIDKGKRAALARIRLPFGAGASVQRLTAPGPGALAGERLDRQWLGADGRWLGRRTVEHVRRVGGAYEVEVGPYSAALVTVRRG